ncbi:MAG: hypothetical protein JJU20_13360 [Opitutales bacterium]|nr:hypothetical protein [Opitutales bacterium]
MDPVDLVNPVFSSAGPWVRGISRAGIFGQDLQDLLPDALGDWLPGESKPIIEPLHRGIQLEGRPPCRLVPCNPHNQKGGAVSPKPPGILFSIKPLNKADQSSSRVINDLNWRIIKVLRIFMRVFSVRRFNRTNNEVFDLFSLRRDKVEHGPGGGLKSRLKLGLPKPAKRLNKPFMPNQLSQSKKRVTVAEHRAVLAALDVIAKAENSTVTDLLRRTLRQIVIEHAHDPSISGKLRSALEQHAPVMPEAFLSPAKVSKFKKEQREFDQFLHELKLASPEELQERNSLVSRSQSVRLTSFA